MLPLKYIPNILTVFRIFSAPCFLLFAHQRAYGVASLIFFIASWTDFLDGWLARHFKLSSHLGAILDPIADKIFLLCAYIMLWEDFKIVPILVIGRDLLILLGLFVAYCGRVNLPIKPLMISKINTGFAMLFPFTWLLLKMKQSSVFWEEILMSFLISLACALTVAVAVLVRETVKKHFTIGPGALFLRTLACAFCLFYIPYIQRFFSWLLSPDLLSIFSGIVIVTTVASGIAYALVFIRALRACSKG